MKKTENRKFGGWQKGLVGLTGLTLVFGLMPVSNGLVKAANAGSGAVVINEVAWAGTADSSNDEWIELYNTTDAAVDMSGWKIKDDGVDAFTFPAGASIAPHAYALMEDRESTISDMQSDFIYNMSLANSGDSLQLMDSTGAVIDTVNGSGGAWYAGAVSNYASMERKDAMTGDLASNFDSSQGGSGAHGATGGPIVGTPKAANSVAVNSSNSVQGVKAEFSAGNWSVGQVVNLQVSIQNVQDLFAYGYELNYDPAVLELQSVVDGSFLSASGTVDTAFQYGLKSGQAGKLLVAEARTVDPKAGVSGSAKLFEVNFVLKSLPGSGTGVVFGSDSFSSSVTGDIALPYSPASWTAPLVANPVTGLVAMEGASRYQIKLVWQASAGADVYQVERKNAHGKWVTLGEVSATEFIDQDSVVGGGKVIPKLNYNYRVVAVKGSVQSAPVEVSGVDNRGIKGDNNRSDLVDGRDLERLALHFAENDQASGFDPLIDTTYDGLVNGSDLIDIGAGFAQQY